MPKQSYTYSYNKDKVTKKNPKGKTVTNIKPPSKSKKKKPSIKKK